MRRTSVSQKIRRCSLSQKTRLLLGKSRLFYLVEDHRRESRLSQKANSISLTDDHNTFSHRSRAGLFSKEIRRSSLIEHQNIFSQRRLEGLLPTEDQKVFFHRIPEVFLSQESEGSSLIKYQKVFSHTRPEDQNLLFFQKYQKAFSRKVFFLPEEQIFLSLSLRSQEVFPLREDHEIFSQRIFKRILHISIQTVLQALKLYSCLQNKLLIANFSPFVFILITILFLP